MGHCERHQNQIHLRTKTCSVNFSPIKCLYSILFTKSDLSMWFLAQKLLLAYPILYY